MAESATVTLLMATYQRPKLLVNALESVKVQIRRPDEMIVISDGDKQAADIAREYSFCKVIYKDHEGVYAAWNAGIRVATGNFVVYLGDDDILKPNYINDMLTAMGTDNYNHNYYYSNHIPAYAYGEDRTFWNSNLKEYNDQTIISEFPYDVMRCKTGRLPSNGAFYQRSLYEGNMYDTQYVCGEDNFWLIRTALRGLLHPKMLPISGYIWYRYPSPSHHVSRQSAGRARVFKAIAAYLKRGDTIDRRREVGGNRVR